jgi:hypothetical protein
MWSDDNSCAQRMRSEAERSLPEYDRYALDRARAFSHQRFKRRHLAQSNNHDVRRAGGPCTTRPHARLDLNP